mgnify:CR=1 FL=1
MPTNSPNRKKILVAIPTCNRHQQLFKVLQDLKNQSIQPDLVVIVDSSDDFREISDQHSDFNVAHIQSKIKSAAEQRNMALDYFKSLKIESGILYFLDDDISIDKDYIANILQRFNANLDAVGISGITNQEPLRSFERNIFSDLLGATGNPGCITRAGINIPIRKSITMGSNSQWLIGCSAWRLESIGIVRFENDFQGNSIFEDVIFSFRMSKKGKLLVFDEIRIEHFLSEIQRASNEKNFSDWIMNRRRILRYDNEKQFSRKKMLLHDLVLLTVHFLKFLKGDRTSWSKCMGITMGLWQIKS